MRFTRLISPPPPSLSLSYSLLSPLPSLTYLFLSPSSSSPLGIKETFLKTIS